MSCKWKFPDPPILLSNGTSSELGWDFFFFINSITWYILLSTYMYAQDSLPCSHIRGRLLLLIHWICSVVWMHCDSWHGPLLMGICFQFVAITNITVPNVLLPVPLHICWSWFGESISSWRPSGLLMFTFRIAKLPSILPVPSSWKCAFPHPQV